MINRGIVSVARRVVITLFAVALFSSLVTLAWGALTAPGAPLATLLGPSARVNQHVLSRAPMLTPGLANLTNAPASSERNPVWSPDCSRIAFRSDGDDQNGDGRLDALNPAGIAALYTVKADGTGLIKYPQQTQNVVGLAWRPDGLAIYVTLYDGAQYHLGYITLADNVLHGLYSTDNEMGALAVTPTNQIVYFEMLDATGSWNIYATDVAPQAQPRALTTTGNNRWPAFSPPYGAQPLGHLVFASDRAGSYRIYQSESNGSNQTVITNPPANTMDTHPQATVDGKLVFISNRLTNLNDTQYNDNIWTMDLAPETITTAYPRYFADPAITSTQNEPGTTTKLSKKDDLLFVSDCDGSEDIFLGAMDDTQAPYVTEEPTVSPRNTVPGAEVKITVPVVDNSSGVRHVWLQVKDPDPAILDSEGINHIITTTSIDYRDRYQALPAPPTRPFVQDVNTTFPVEFGPYDPFTDAYLDLTLNTSHPGYYAEAGSPYLFYDEGAGYPQVPLHWVEMYDDGTNGDDTANDGVYTCQWTTPNKASDWYFDIITEDFASNEQYLNEWHGNRRRFDNISGCSTLPFTGGKNILFVSDYADGHRFLSQGLPPAALTNDAASYPSELFYFLGINPTSPFLPSSSFGGVDLWRMQARGPIPVDVYTSYTPQTVQQISPTDQRTPVSVRHGGKVIVWVSPALGSYQLGAGSIIDATTQARLQTFTNAGGRLYMIGSDVATALTQGGKVNSSFLQTVLGANLKKQTVSTIAATATPPATWETTRMPEASATWYGSTLAFSYWEYHFIDELPITLSIPTQELIPHNSNPGQFVNADYYLYGRGDYFVWDTLFPTSGATADWTVQESAVATDPPETIGVSRVNANTKSRTIFWTFAPEHLSSYYRNAPMRDSVEWLLDGVVKGVVAQENTLGPIAGALVTINEVTTVVTAGVTTEYLKPVGATLTDAVGGYELYGVRPGPQYRIKVVANGYYGTLTKDISVRGGSINSGTYTSFFLLRDINTCTAWGYVLQDGAAVAGAMVTASPLGGSGLYSATSDANGRYSITNLPTGPYVIIAEHPGSHVTAQSSNIDLTMGQIRRVPDLVFGVNGPMVGTLAGTVTGNGLPISGATVVVRDGVNQLTLSTDISGRFSTNTLPANQYTIEASAAGFATATQQVTYNPAIGAMVNLNLIGLSNDTGAAQVTGRVYDATTGNALAGAQVDVLVGNQVVSTINTVSPFQIGISTYNFSFQLDPGAYRLRVSSTGRKTLEQSFTLAPGQLLTGVEFRMEPLLSLAQGVHLFSLPGDYGTQSFATVLGVTPTYLADDRLATYNALTGYQKYTIAAQHPIEPGRAYWIRLDTAKAIQQEGTAISTAAPFVRSLQTGWNLVGNPFPFIVDLYDCNVRTAAGTQGWSAAMVAGTVGGGVYTWNGQEYRPSFTLQPYAGYWVYASATCDLLIANRASMRSTEGIRSVRSQPSTADWQVRLEARAGDARDTTAVLGVSLTGGDGFVNTADLRKPPTPVGDYVTVAFVRRNWGAASGGYSTDIQAPTAQEKRWSVRVESNQPDTDIVLSWPEITAQLPAGYDAILTDLATRQQCYLNTSAQYAFRLEQGVTAREFEITVNPRLGTLSVTDVHGIEANRAGGQSRIAFTLSQPAEVQVLIRTQNGRLIRTLTSTGIMDAGAQALLWDQKDQAGHAIPRGQYLCEVRAIEPNGRQARASGLVLVRL